MRREHRPAAPQFSFDKSTFRANWDHPDDQETWRDEYLKRISGFANAEGGALVIGMNDKGEIIGVPESSTQRRVVTLFREELKICASSAVWCSSRMPN